ncbi:MAG: DNA primase small subunit domain-containing protein [Candidatus Hodarchaeota archaeon]
MKEINYLQRLFQAYYKQKKNEIPLVNLYNQREFGFIPWDKMMMIRHKNFREPEDLKNYLIKNPPKHLFSSGTLYNDPGNPNMSEKGYLGCDFLIDIDVDHFFTPCKNHHDLWYCKDCENNGIGMPPDKCTKCGKTNIQNLSWICDDCLNVAKNEILKLVQDFLVPDFGIEEKDLKIAFSGHRGYHLKIENQKMRKISSSERREIVDYLTGDNISYDILGLDELGSDIGLLEQNVGWSQKIVKKIKHILLNYPRDVIIDLLRQEKFGLNTKIIEYIVNNKESFLKSLWEIEGLGLKTWHKFLDGIIKEVGAEIDKPVSIDVHRLIRYPGSLHGKTGFRVQQLNLKQLEDFNPLDEKNQDIDPIIFISEQENLKKYKIIEKVVPAIKIKGEIFGPYKKDEIINIPHHIAVFLLCKEVAKII